MKQANVSSGIVGLRPVGGSRDGRCNCAHKADADGKIGCRSAFPAAAQALQRVKRERRSPGADRDVSQYGMERMTEPGAVKKILDLAFDHPPHGLLQRLSRIS